MEAFSLSRSEQQETFRCRLTLTVMEKQMLLSSDHRQVHGSSCSRQVQEQEYFISEQTATNLFLLIMTVMVRLILESSETIFKRAIKNGGYSGAHKAF